MSSPALTNELTCPICVTLIHDCHTFKCGHLFCRPCIQIWFKHNDTCPTCRQAGKPHPMKSIDRMVDILVDSFTEEQKKEREEYIKGIVIALKEARLELSYTIDYKAYDYEEICCICDEELDHIELRLTYEEAYYRVYHIPCFKKTRYATDIQDITKVPGFNKLVSYHRSVVIDLFCTAASN